jgi:hypothetical protein
LGNWHRKPAQETNVCKGYVLPAADEGLDMAVSKGLGDVPGCREGDSWYIAAESEAASCLQKNWKWQRNFQALYRRCPLAFF